MNIKIKSLMLLGLVISSFSIIESHGGFGGGRSGGFNRGGGYGGGGRAFGIGLGTGLATGAVYGGLGGAGYYDGYGYGDYDNYDPAYGYGY